MCLCKIDKVIKEKINTNKVYIPPPDKHFKYGYKVFDCVGEELRFEFRPYGAVYKVPLGKWLTAEHQTLKTEWTAGADKRESYDSGFHIFPTLQAARIWMGKPDYNQKIVRIKYRRLMYIGKQKINSSRNLVSVIVAKEIYIPIKWKDLL